MEHRLSRRLCEPCCQVTLRTRKLTQKNDRSVWQHPTSPSSYSAVFTFCGSASCSSLTQSPVQDTVIQPLSARLGVLDVVDDLPVGEDDDTLIGWVLGLGQKRRRI